MQVLSRNNIYSEIQTIDNTPHPFWLLFLAISNRQSKGILFGKTKITFVSSFV